MTQADDFDIFDLAPTDRPEREPAKPCAVSSCIDLRMTRDTVWCAEHRRADQLNGQAVPGLLSLRASATSGEVAA